MYCVEARDTAKHARIQGQSPNSENCPTQKADSALCHVACQHQPATLVPVSFPAAILPSSLFAISCLHFLSLSLPLFFPLLLTFSPFPSSK